MPEFLPAAACWSLAFWRASSSACFLFIRVFFQVANDSGVTGVRFVPSLWRCDAGDDHRAGREDEWGGG